MNTTTNLEQHLADRLNQSRALLVGVNRYENLDASQQLLGGINDVLSFWKVCRRMGFHPANIVLLTSPVLTVDQLVGVEQEMASELREYAGKTDADIANMVKGWFAEEGAPKVLLALATRANIDEGVQWIAQPVVSQVVDRAITNRFLTFSGHGTTLEHDEKAELALCPCDVVKNGDVSTYLRTDDLRDQLKGAAETTTVVLDCCFAASEDQDRPAGRYLIPTLSGLTKKSATLDMSGVEARVFCASAANEVGYQAILNGKWHGAFSWSLTVALEQWAIVRGKGIKKHSTISNIELLFRARMLLESLSFPQHPVLIDAVGNKPFMGQGTTDADEPDRGDRRAIQMDGGGKDYRWYTITQTGTSKSSFQANVLVTNSAGNIGTAYYEANMEYWRGVGTEGPTPAVGVSLHVAWKDYRWNDSPPDAYRETAPSFQMNRLAQWVPSMGSYDCFYEQDRGWGLAWWIGFRAGQWQGSITWYNASESNNVFGGGATGSTLPYTEGATPKFYASWGLSS